MDKNIKAQQALVDKQQTVWQLATIQLAGWTSLPILATSILLLEENSFLGAALTIIVGNAVLWFIRFGIIAMSHKKRQSTLDISQDYLGKFGGYFIAILLLVSTLVWFIAQTTAASHSLTRLIPIYETSTIDRFTQMSVLLGVISTFLCMEGIVVLRKLSTLSFPILLIAFFVAIFILPSSLDKESSDTTFSLSGLTLVLGTNLGITSDMPTFFRHSQSWRNSIIALTVIQLISLGIGLCSLFFGSVITRSFEINEEAVLESGSIILRVSLIILVFFSVICANVANVYSASVGWEIVAPTALVGRKEYMILGLGLTMIFILLSNLFSLDLFINISDSSLVNLCLVLILGYVISRYKKKLPDKFEQKTYFIAWLLSTIINAFQFLGLLESRVSPLVVGAASILLIVFLSSIVRKIAYNKLFSI